ncbi:MAG: Hsp20/alpha crystallin family protein [Acidobacteria bacterium]|nr:Hsp20/alpha crystallin family protein [Acidobacteriota bacterium]
MTTRRWDPLRDLLTLQERMNRLFEEALLRTRPHAPALLASGWTPMADVYETAEGFVVQVELPGVGEDDVEVHVDGDELTLRGVRRMGSPMRPESFHRMERNDGAFSRTFKFTEDVDPGGVTAQLRDGLLRLDLPKARRRAPRRPRGEDPA